MLINLLKTIGIPTKSWPTYDGQMLDRSEFLTASEASACLRKTWFGKQPNLGEKAFSGNGYTERGNAIENWLVEMFRGSIGHGVVPMYMGENQRSFYNADDGLSGTPDGLLVVADGSGIVGAGEYVLVEFKSIDPRANKSSLPKKAHVMQVQINMHLVSQCLSIDVNRAVLLYVDASNLFDQKEFEIIRNDEYYNHAVDRATQLWGAGAADDLEPEGLKTGDCDNCSFTAECSAYITIQKANIANGGAGFFAPPTAVDGLAVSLTETEEVVLSNYIALSSQAKVLDDALETVKNEAKALVLDKGGDVRYGGKRFSTRVDAGRVAFNTALVEAALTDAGLEVADFKKTGAPYVVFACK